MLPDECHRCKVFSISVSGRSREATPSSRTPLRRPRQRRRGAGIAAGPSASGGGNPLVVFPRENAGGPNISHGFHRPPAPSRLRGTGGFSARLGQRAVMYRKNEDILYRTMPAGSGFYPGILSEGFSGLCDLRFISSESCGIFSSRNGRSLSPARLS